jgi:MFS transporter, CP family, cyanate transporter
VLSWLPSIYRDLGYSAAAAGLLLSVAGLVQVPVALALPEIAARAGNQVIHLTVSTVVIGAGLAGILLAPTAAPYLWVGLVGIGQGASFALALSLFVLRTRRVAETARLSAMAQSIGYVLAAGGPFAIGVIHEATRSWTPPLMLLLVLLVPQLWSGALAGRPRRIEEHRHGHLDVRGGPQPRPQPAHDRD